MRIAMDHSVMAEGIPPGAEERLRDHIPLFQWARLVIEELAAIEPCHGQEPLGRKLRQKLRNQDGGVVFEDAAIERHVPRFEIVVEFLAKARADFADDFRGIERGVHPLIDAHYDAKLIEIGFHR